MSFVGRIKREVTWERFLLYRHPQSGYCGKPIPHARVRPNALVNPGPGQIRKTMSSAQVVKAWVKSLKAEGRMPQVVNDGEYITVSAP